MLRLEKEQKGAANHFACFIGDLLDLIVESAATAKTAPWAMLKTRMTPTSSERPTAKSA